MLGLMLVIAIQAGDPASQDLAQFGPLPRDVAAFIDRRTSCNHFAGEFNGDRSERDREVTRAMNQLRCGRLEADEAALKRRHAKAAKVLRALSETRDWQ
jgi:hypothetical protein